jgi:hypothetical protein
MKQTFLCLAATLVIVACNTDKKTDDVAGATKVDKPAVALPYTASYSSSFEMGDPAHSATILQGSWKDWENNKMENMKSWIADTIVAFHSDNTMIRGADSLVAAWTRNRARYTAVIDTIQAVLPTYSTDKKENWVLVWAKEINTRADGHKDTAYIMETWRINKDGKADMLLQYDRAKRKI